jgi:hypothetical protein
MLPLQALLAIDLANERSREAAELARRHRDAELLAEEKAEHPDLYVARPGRGRLAVAGLLHLVEGGASSVARSAGDAASRLDRSSA